MNQDQQLAARPQVAMSLADLGTMAKSIAASRMFGVDTEDQAMALMLLCQAEGLHPIMALRRYHIIEGKPAYRADALQGEFERDGGILWHERSDTECSATFFRDKKLAEDNVALTRARQRYRLLKENKSVADLAMPGELTIVRTLQDAVDKKVAMSWNSEKGEWKMKKNWRQSPRQMLHARCLTEGVRAINPGLVAGIYSEDEIHDMVTLSPEDEDQRPPPERAEVIERNVREATANATGDPLYNSKGEQTGVVAPIGTNEFGPLTITRDNYRELVLHIGKAQGNLLGKKVGSFAPPVIEWLYNKWRNELSPSASQQDMRLKKAIEYAQDDIKNAPPKEEMSAGERKSAESAVRDSRPTEGEACPATQPMTPERAESILSGKGDIGARQAYINDLRARLEDMVLTEDQAMAHFAKQGVSAQGWKSLDDMPDSMLQFLSLPQNWRQFRQTVEAELKPKPSAEAPKKKGGRRKK